MRTPVLAPVAVATLLAFTPRAALAADDDAAQISSAPPTSPVSVAEEAPRDEPRSYGWQTLLVDGGALSLVVVGVARGERELSGLGVGAYAFGPPAVHVAHGRFGRAGIDLASRVVLPIGAGAAGVGFGVLLGGVATGGDDTGSLFAMGLLGFAGGVLGVASGYVAAVAIDAAVLAAPDKADVARARARARTSPGPRVVPTFGADARGATAGLAGVF